MKTQEEKLKKLLQITAVKGFNELYAKLVINDIRLNGDILALDAILDVDKHYSLREMSILSDRICTGI